MPATGIAQQKKLEKQRIVISEEISGKAGSLHVLKGNTAAVSSTAVEMERERKKNLMSSAERVLAAKAMINPNAASSRLSTDGLRIFNGTLSIADPTFNRTLSIAQGGACGLSGAGTAVHYKTHNFTLPSAGNVTISLVAADGASITPGSADTFLELYGPGGFVPAAACTNFIASNDDAVGILSRIVTTTPLAAGTYTIVVTSFSNTPGDFPWTYSLALITPAVPACPNAILYGYDFNNDHLVSFNANTPGTLLTDIALTGFNTGEFLTGIDFRPSDGLLYGIATNGVNDRVVLINTTTGAITAVGGTVPAITGIFFGMDFNPVVDRIRNVDDNENNRRLNPITGALAATDAALAYAPADPGFGTNPSVVHVAYDRNNVGTPLTTLYGIDAANDVLVTIGGIDGSPSPNTGQLTTVGALGINTSSFGGFDIEPNSNQAYASLRIAGVSQLFTINLGTGAATLVGTIGGGGLAIDGLAISPVIIVQPSNVTACSGSVASFTVATNGTPAFQWQVNTGSGFTNLTNGTPYSNVTTATLTINPAAFSMNGYLYRCVVTIACGSFTSSSVSLTIKQVIHTAVLATPSVMCSPGATLITGTATTGTGNYTHTLTGAGTIVQNPPTGTNNSNASFNVSSIPAGNQTYILTSTDASGCSVSSNVSVTVNPAPVITFTPAAPVICNGFIQSLTASGIPPIVQTFSQPATIIVPAGSPVTTTGNADPYPSQINISGLPTTGVTVKSVKLGNINHTFPDDVDVVLVSPTGQAVILMSDVGGSDDINGLDYTLDDAAAANLADAVLNPQGTYKPTNFGSTDNFPAPGPGSLTQATPTLASFTGNLNGDWKLYVVDDQSGEFGYIGNWSISFNIAVPVTYSPVTNLFTDAAALVPYTGTPVFGSVYAKPSATSTYTATATRIGCTGTANVTVTVNQLPAITAQPTPATQTVCPGPGSIVTYTVAATGTAITYQWRRNTVALVNGIQPSGSTVAGATTNTLTITNVTLPDAGNYDVVVSNTCPPAVTSTAVALVIATAPAITTQPANVIACDGGTATFSIVAAGSPAPTTYQWQVSTAAVPAFTSVLIPSATTPSLILNNVTIGMSGNKYRVVISNTCGQFIVSNGLAALTVNAIPIVTATALPARICLSDGPVALVGSPAGGSWSGIGVSGFNFIPGATAVGTYTLTYTFTNSLSCPASATVIAKVVSDAECGRLRLLRDNALILYPNPNNGNFNIRINTILYNYLNIRVFTSSGNLVSTRNYTGLVYGQVVPVNLSHLPAGTYMVRFFYDDGNRTSEKVFPVVISR